MSNYYQAIAEPVLYKDIECSEETKYTLSLLLLTPIDRNELALHISTIRWNSGNRSGRLCSAHHAYDPDEARKRLDALMWDRASKIRAKIDEVTTTDRGFTGDKSEKLRWFSNVVTGGFLGRIDVDTILALIRCMAVNIERINIHDEHVMHLTRNSLSTPWTDDITGPFHRLKALTISPKCAGAIAPSLPSMVSLQIGSPADFIGKYYRDDHGAST
jgi:hypothetical protein